jgi:glycosyltransferase involved in cell wall biosynthesis
MPRRTAGNSSERSQKPPRIAIVRHSGYPSDMHIRRDAMALRDAGFEVDLLCDRESGKPLVERVDGIRVTRIPPRHRRGGPGRYVFEYVAFPVLATLVTALRSLRRPYSWIEINNMPDWLMIAAVLPRLLGTRVTLYSREDMARLLAADHDLSPNHPAVRLLRTVARVCSRAADRIIVTQELARRELVEQGLPEDKIVAVPNSPDESVFLARLPGHAAESVPKSRDDSRFRIVTHGTLVKRYGIETLIEAMDSVRTAIPSAHLEIIGDGEYRAALEALVDRLELRSHVTFAGYLPEYEDVAPRLAQADLGVVPIWTDFQLCNKLVDYLALGLPAVTTESAALRPYLDDCAVQYVAAKNVLALADAIIALARDPMRRAALGAMGLAAYRQHFAWDQARDRYLAVYAAAAGVREDLGRRVEAANVPRPHGSAS